MFFAFLYMLAVALMAAPVALVYFGIPIGMITTIVFEAVGVIVLAFTSYLSAYKKFFVIAESNQAVVRTGGLGRAATSEPVVAIGKGLWCIPMLHRYQMFQFEQWVLTVNRENNNALLCKDNLLANASITFKISVPQNREDVLKFLAAVGKRDITQDTIHILTGDTLETALRDACTSRPYQTVFESRDEVGAEIEKSVANDLPKIGLQLDSAKMTDVEPTPIDYYQQQNPQHAKGLTEIVKITEDQRLFTESKKLETSQAIRDKEVSTQKQLLTLAQAEEFAKSEQTKQVVMRQNEDKRAAEEHRIQEEETVTKREIERAKTIELDTIAKERQAEEERVRKEQALAEAEVVKTKAVNLAREDERIALIEKQKEAEVAEADKKIALARKAAEEAEAEAARQEKEAAAEEARQKVETVRVVETAGRLKEEAVITQQAESEQAFIKAQRAADASAYAIERDARARETAAQADYEAKTKAAQALQKEAEARAAGERAAKMIPVDVEREYVAIERERVAILEQELKAKTEHAEAALSHEIRKLEIEKAAEVKIALAGAMATLTSNVKATLYGDADTLLRVNTGMAKAFGFASFLEGLGKESPDWVKDTIKAGSELLKEKLADKTEN